MGERARAIADLWTSLILMATWRALPERSKTYGSVPATKQMHAPDQSTYDGPDVGNSMLNKNGTKYPCADGCTSPHKSSLCACRIGHADLSVGIN